MNTLKILRIMHLAILAGILLFFGVVLLLKANSEFVLVVEEWSDFLLPVLLVIAAVTACSFIVPRLMLNNLRLRVQGYDRIKGYTPIAIVRMALMEAGMMICIVFFLIAGSWIYNLVLTLLVLIYLGIFPTLARMERDLEISIDDLQLKKSDK